MSARSHGNPTFASSIFGSAPPIQERAEPAGKRRDQTTAEMFGSYEEKDLRSQPKTFVPRENQLTARERMQQSLDSQVLHRSSYSAASNPGNIHPEARPPRFEDESHDDRVNTHVLRQREMQSVLFGREPVEDPELLYSPTKRALPNDMSWHAHNEIPPSDVEVQHRDRAFQEKCSSVFDHQTPQTLDSHLQSERRFREEESDADARRRSNVYYSDLFGRSAYSDAAGSSVAGQRPLRPPTAREDRHIVHSDWMDSKTELMSRSDRPEHAHLRKSEELHQSRVMNQQPSHGWEASSDRAAPMTFDNSEKVRSAVGRTPSEIHQAHMRSSDVRPDFYSNASTSTRWEVAELRISGLGQGADDAYVRSLCRGLDLHIVKAAAEMDPVRNLCAGRAKVTVRYNPDQSSLDSLVDRFHSSNLRVDM